MAKKKTAKKTVEPNYTEQRTQQSFWDLGVKADEVSSTVGSLHYAVSELESIVSELVQVIDNKATAIVEAIEKHTTAIVEREWEKHDVD